MKNKNFRSRLRQQKTELNPAAWTQMEEMLNGIPLEEAMPQKSVINKKQLFLLLFLLVGALYFILKSFDGITAQLGLLQQNEIKEQAKIEFLKDPDTILSKKSSTILPFVGVEGIALIDSEGKHRRLDNVTDNDKSHEVREKDHLELENTSQNSEQFIDENSIQRNAMKSSNNSTNSDLSNLTSNVDVSYNSKHSSSLNLTNYKRSNSTTFLSESSGVNLLNRKYPSEVVNDRTIVERIGGLDRRVGLLNNSRDRLLPLMSPKVDISQYRNLALSFNAGLANVNGKNGYHLSFGLYRDINDLIGLEIGSWYTTGSIYSNVLKKTIERESQFDLGFLVHLNLINTYTHRVSLELGSAYAFYRSFEFLGSNEESRIENNFNGFSYQLGISYLNNFSSNQSVGLKLGTTIFNDSAVFLSAKYIRHF